MNMCLIMSGYRERERERERKLLEYTDIKALGTVIREQKLITVNFILFCCNDDDKFVIQKRQTCYSSQ
jgi:hypothetical protein